MCSCDLDGFGGMRWLSLDCFSWGAQETWAVRTCSINSPVPQSRLLRACESLLAFRFSILAALARLSGDLCTRCCLWMFKLLLVSLVSCPLAAFQPNRLILYRLLVSLDAVPKRRNEMTPCRTTSTTAEGPESRYSIILEFGPKR